MKAQKHFFSVVTGLVILLFSMTLFAEPMTTGFTYQGRLLDAGEPADGTYDLQCKLFDSKENGLQIGDTLVFEDGTSTDGYFTVEIDFGVEVFNGEGRYLEMAFRPGDDTLPEDFVVLEPRTELTATPYALQTRGMYVDPNLLVGIGTITPTEKLEVDGTIKATALTGDGSGLTNLPSSSLWNQSGSNIYYNSGNVGIGTTSPDEELVIGEPLGLGWGLPAITVGNTSGGGFACGNSTNHLMIDHGSVFQRARITSSSDGWGQGDIEFKCANVGIGTPSPSAKLDVVGTFQLEDGNEADGKLLVSDATGNATWKKGRTYTLSGTLNTPSITATTTWAKMDDFVTFTKNNSGTDIEVVMNTRVRGGTFAGGALAVKFQIRIDDNTTSLDNEAAIAVSGGEEFVSIIAVFQDLSTGNHTVSVWAQAVPGGTSNPVSLDPGGLDGRILVKEVW